jgi:hypothetical protein
MTVTHEFYSPFAHLPGRWEVARIHTTTHGSFDVWIVIHTTTDQPVTVYVNGENGERYMRDRYPESTAIRVAPDDLVIKVEPDGSRVTAHLTAGAGPHRGGDLTFTAVPGAAAEAVPYGGEAFAVWGSRWSCTGVDLAIPAAVTGTITGADGTPLPVDTPDGGIITLGSYGHLVRD